MLRLDGDQADSDCVVEDLGTNDHSNDAPELQKLKGNASELQKPHRSEVRSPTWDFSNEAPAAGGSPSQGNGIARALDELGKQQLEHEMRIETLLIQQEESIAGKLKDLHREICHASNAIAPQRPGSFLPKPPSVDPKPPSADNCIPLPHQVLEEARSSTDPVDDLVLDKSRSRVTRHDVDNGVAPRKSLTSRFSISRTTIASSQTDAQSYKGLLEAMSNFSRNVRNNDHSFMDGSESTASAFRLLISDLVTDRRFEMTVCVVIVANALMIGFEADFEMTNPHTDLPHYVRVANITFIILFTIELMLRLVAEASSFFALDNVKIRWNIFDTLIVVSAIIEEVLFAIDTSSTSNMSLMRILRTLRVVRGFRVVRVFAFFRDLRIMVAGIMQSTASLIWAISLLLGVMFIFSVCFMQFAIGEHKAQSSTSNPKPNTILNADEYADLLRFFGSLSTTIYTLYLSIVGGIDWGEASDPLMKLNTLLGLLFLFYIAFAVLCVLNIITGVFVENSIQRTSEDDDMVMMEQLKHRRKWLEEVKDLFDKADADGSGLLDAKEFATMLEDFRMQAWLRKLGVQVEAYSAAGLFQLLDFDGDGRVNIDEFATSLQLVNGTAKSIDVARGNQETRMLRKEVQELSAACSGYFKKNQR